MARYSVSWEGRCLLVATKQWRPASAEESAPYLLTEDTVLVGKQLAEKGKYQHKPEEAPPVQKPEERQLEIQDAILSSQEMPRSPAVQETNNQRAAIQSGKEEVDENGVWKDIDEQYDEYSRGLNRGQATLKEDVPQSVRTALQNQSRKRGKFEPQQLLLERLPAITMVGSLEDGSQNGTTPTQNKRLGEDKIKELDPKYFDQTKKVEWRQWIRNAGIRILTPQEAKKIPRIKVFPVPLRIVRTNESTALSELAKSRLVASGHTDPQLGEFLNRCSHDRSSGI